MPTQITQPNVLDSGTTQSVSSVVSNSISPKVGQLIQIFVFNKGPNNTTANTPSISGLSISWIQVATHQSSFSNGEWRMTEYVGVITSVTSGTLTISCAGQSQQALCYAILQYPNNVKLNTNNPAASIVQTQNSENNSTVTSLSISMGGFANKNNGTVAAFSNDGQAAFTGSSNMTTLVNDSTGFGSIFVCWSPTNIGSPEANFASNNATGKVNLGSEIAFQGPAGAQIF